MICDSCLKYKNCRTDESQRVLLTWCPNYVYSRKVELINERNNVIKYGRNK